MLISERLEKTPSVVAAENMANRLADNIRNCWLGKREQGVDRWEENFFEDPDGVRFLRGEAFPNLQGIDYIFKWWGGKEIDALSGELEVLWKVIVPETGRMEIYKSWIRFADRDFVLGAYPTEPQKREANRAEFRKAFQKWKDFYNAQVSGPAE